MKKVLGIFALLLFVCVFTSVLNKGFVSPYNMYNITRWSALPGRGRATGKWAPLRETGAAFFAWSAGRWPTLVK